VKWHGAKVTAAERIGAARGLFLWASHVEEEAKRIVPFDKGTLARSSVASVDESALKAAVSFDTPYAVVQHEDLTLHHAMGRMAKYLERPLNDPATIAVGHKIIAREIGKVMK